MLGCIKILIDERFFSVWESNLVEKGTLNLYLSCL